MRAFRFASPVFAAAMRLSTLQDSRTTSSDARTILFNPKKLDRQYPDERSKEIMQKTVAFFESKGKTKLKADDREFVWYADFVEFIKKERIFETLLTPSAYGASDCRWDTWRNCEFNEILGFYGLCYWYVWQVSVLGLGPIWMSKNEECKRKAAQHLKNGAIFAFGLSEKEHGADLYSSDMMLLPQKDGTYKASGDKYYIGNGNKAAMVSTFGKNKDTGDYVFFVADSQHKNYELIKNVVNSQSYVAEFALHDYPITEADILSKGSAAWDSALNTVNVGKYNLGWASIGICTHAFYEAINHASKRQLYGKFVTEFPQIKQLFTDAYCRLVAMKLFALRASDYMRCGSAEDRRYLLYNPVVKMKVTTQGEEVINCLWDVIAAKGFEKDMFFDMAARDIRALPKLEGTVHVNMALIIKFMKNYFFRPAKFPEVPQNIEAKHDDFLFNQGPTKGLGGIQFHDFNIAYRNVKLQNAKIMREQIQVMQQMLMEASPNAEQSKDLDFLLTLGEMFTLVCYGQLLIENASIYKIDDDLMEQIFDFMVRDFSKFALQLYSKTNISGKQMEFCMKMIRKPVKDVERFERVYKSHLLTMSGQYEMNK